VTQITATMRVNSGWSGQYGLLDYSCKPSPFRDGLLTCREEFNVFFNPSSFTDAKIVRTDCLTKWSFLIRIPWD